MATEIITSTDNRWLKRARRAADIHDDEILLEGPKQIVDALSRGLSPIAVLVREGQDAPEGCDPRHVRHVSERAFRALGETSTSQGVLALFARPQDDLQAIVAASGAIVALDGIQDPGNVGAIIRLAAAFEMAGVAVLSGSADPFSPRAIRGSAGTVLTTPVARGTRQSFIDLCAANSRRLFAAMPSGPSVERGLPSDAVVVLGSEGKGVSPEIARLSSPFAIPTSSRVESLNVATAAAIVLWEISRGVER